MLLVVHQTVRRAGHRLHAGHEQLHPGSIDPPLPAPYMPTGGDGSPSGERGAKAEPAVNTQLCQPTCTDLPAVSD